MVRGALLFCYLVSFSGSQHVSSVAPVLPVIPIASVNLAVPIKPEVRLVVE